MSSEGGGLAIMVPPVLTASLPREGMGIAAAALASTSLGLCWRSTSATASGCLRVASSAAFASSAFAFAASSLRRACSSAALRCAALISSRRLSSSGGKVAASRSSCSGLRIMSSSSMSCLISAVALRISRMTLPRPFAIADSIFGPRKTSATTSMTTSSPNPRLNTTLVLALKGCGFHHDSLQTDGAPAKGAAAGPCELGARKRHLQGWLERVGEQSLVEQLLGQRLGAVVEERHFLGARRCDRRLDLRGGGQDRQRKASLDTHARQRFRMRGGPRDQGEAKAFERRQRDGIARLRRPKQDLALGHAAGASRRRRQRRLIGTKPRQHGRDARMGPQRKACVEERRGHSGKSAER